MPGRYGLLVQSCAASRLVEPHDPVAPYFGDGATAVVVGPVASGGILGSVHFVDGRYPDTLVAGVPGGAWYDPGRAVMHVADPAGLRAVLLQTVDLCKRSVDAVLPKCGCAPAAIDFFCIHQGTSWLLSLAQEATQLQRAATIDIFSKTGYLFSASIPLGLRLAEDSGVLGERDLALLFGGGTGVTYGATVIEWGR
jgi:3-oxoacyl-[acyl-carrier-protein] synthase III